MGLFVLAVGILFLVQAKRVRFVFDEDSFEVKTVSESEEGGLGDSGENFAVGGANRWKYSSFVNWTFFPEGFLEKGIPPILAYFKETQTPEKDWMTGPGKLANSEEALAKG